MKQKKLLRKRHNIAKKRALRAADPSFVDEQRKRTTAETIARGMKIMDELDPIMRETFKDDPEKLAEWEDIMKMREDPDEEEDN